MSKTHYSVAAPIAGERGNTMLTGARWGPSRIFGLNPVLLLCWRMAATPERAAERPNPGAGWRPYLIYVAEPTCGANGNSFWQPVKTGMFWGQDVETSRHRHAGTSQCQRVGISWYVSLSERIRRTET